MNAADLLLDSAGGTAASLVPRKARQEPPEFDITAMVDLVFMMNIYFLVTFVTVALSEVDLPSANRVEALDSDDAVIVTVLGSLDGKTTTLYLADGEKGEPIKDSDEQQRQLRAHVEAGASAGKTDVLLKAEKRVRLGDLFRMASAAAVEGLKLHVAVHEKDMAP